MNVVIVEDEFMVAKRLLRFVEKTLSKDDPTIRQFSTLGDASDHLATAPVDVLFLDLNLNGQDGFELLKQQVSRSFHTIVVSANTDRAIEAFEIGVTDFVAKPFSLERVEKAISRLNYQEHAGQSKYLSYRIHGRIELLPLKDVVYLKAAGHYCEVFTVNGQSILHDKNLEKLLVVLPQSFIRVHRSYAVSLPHAKSILSEEGSKYWLVLSDGCRIPIGRTRVKALKEQLL